MRVSKDPEIRKQELIDVAMKVFAEKGFEAASMKDIAREAGVVPGLCYHYFQNKQALYEMAVTHYAVQCSRPITGLFARSELTLDEMCDALGTLMMEQDKAYPYKSFFDKEGNEWFHRQLDCHMEKEVVPPMERYLQSLMDREEIPRGNVPLLAKFIFSGMITVMNQESVPMPERIKFLKDILYRVLNSSPS